MGALAGWRRSAIAAGALALSAALGGAAAGASLRFDLPDVRALADFKPPLATRVLARDGNPLASFGEQRRILLRYADIPKHFEHALIAVEDKNFYRHGGVDLAGIARAAWHDLKTMSLEQGASTITQQLARNLFLQPDKRWRRKLQELLLALEIEKQYSKQEILEMYCNQVYMGHGRYGLEAAARFYFGKTARELDLPEAALLAGLIQRPETLSPFRDPDRARRRRNHVLERMLEEGYIRRGEAERAQRAPIRLAPASEDPSLASYFVEEVRRWLRDRFGDEAVYQGGLEVRTTLDVGLQQIANRAVEWGLRELDRRRGWRGRLPRVPAGADPATWQAPSWKNGVSVGDVADGVVVAVDGARARVRVGPYTGFLGAGEIRWTGRSSPAALFRPGHIVRVGVRSVGSDNRALLSLEQDPEVEGALIALDPKTGAVRALVGGFDFRRSEFDRAIQARRQAGSAFKPVVYAAAIERGLGASHRILDEPTLFIEPGTWRPYRPENYDLEYSGLVTLRTALERSANVATVKLLDEIGPEPVIDLARRLGITTKLEPYPSMALGAFEVSPLEMVSAFGVFADLGVRVEPHLVERVLSSQGELLERVKPDVREVLSPQVAYLTTNLLRGVVARGTGAAASALGRPLAGKTGTTDDCTDAWFIGYCPDLVVGVWVGFDMKRTLGRRETGAVAALPIWMRFMEEALERIPPRDFEVPEGISVVTVDRRTGLRASGSAGCSELLEEAFVAGSEPTEFCSPLEHLRVSLPPALQRYPLGEGGKLRVPAADLDRLALAVPGFELRRGGGWVQVAAPEGPVSLRIVATEEPGRIAPPPEIAEREELVPWLKGSPLPPAVQILGRARVPGPL